VLHISVWLQQRVLLILKIQDCHYAMIGSGMKISGVLNPPPVGCSVCGRSQMLGNVVGKLQITIGGAGGSVVIDGKVQTKNGVPVGSTVGVGEKTGNTHSKNVGFGVGSNVGSLGAVCLNYYSLNNMSDTISLVYAFRHT
jgi:hypothetical protein